MDWAHQRTLLGFVRTHIKDHLNSSQLIQRTLQPGSELKDIETT
jgi:hypothetical protein